ncbi:MAG: HAD family phosphatase [Solobacterium sp.]|jgi:HAD superfamily hydrolase (TIGR01509 family)|nr:HAD family phosphatase [Solobacterium sp.]MCH4222158.1 HAD family phosphatase [Solobacterium sp.]MCH4265628.1 HAD family phosphatase [Solobacterium sp.]
MNKPELVIFDVDGTLLNTEFLWQKAWEETGRRHGVEGFGDQIFRKVVGISGKAVENVLEKELPERADRLEILNEARITGKKLLEKEVDVMPGTREILAYLSAMDVNMAVATTTSREMTEERLKKLALWDYFKLVLCGDEVKKRKPDPEIYLSVLKKMNCRCDQCLVIEDTGYGVQSAYSAGIPVIMVPSVNQPNEVQLRQAVMVKKNLLEVKKVVEETLENDKSYGTD